MNYSSEKGFLYTQASSFKGSVAVTGGPLQGFVYWSANELANSSSTSQWGVRATIMDKVQYISPNQTATTNNFQCSIVSTAKNWTPPKMPAQESLDEWAEHMYGAIRNQSSWTYKPQLERVLNTMSILSGSENSAWLHIQPGQSSTYGCLVNGSVCSIEVVILFYALFLVLLMVIGIDLYAFLSYKFGGVWEKGKELSYVPTDLISWQLAMVKKSTGNEGLTTGDLKEIGFSYVREGEGMQELEFKEMEAAGANAPLLPMTEYESMKKESPTMTVTEKFGPSTP
ncbi:hypothetical protein OCU04_007839 [Sclerotinia nivalis]|uniref:Uncharacterized protein n=1 Tax=Sclerotinia nivalis TaxID=352851 RepID=A0A9X0DIB2_9HELO|nr:hypothetical protein OCU04_007839 [Sclerotinia nivalis]